MTPQNVITDLSVLLGLPVNVLKQLVDKIDLCIGDIIIHAKNNKDQIVVINIGIGNLSINLAEMQCKFVPSKKLKATIKDCLEENINPLELQLEDEFRDKLIKLFEKEI